MGARLRSLLLGKVFVRAAAVAVLALAALAVFSSSGGAGGQPRGEASRPPADEREGVIDLNEMSESPRAGAARPAEEVSEGDLASIEQKIKARSAEEPAADDGVSPGAPSDEEVREDLRQLMREKRALAAGPIRRGSGDLVWPIDGLFTSPFGQRWGRLHAGIDLAAPTGTPIRAVAAGEVILMAPTGGYGKYTCINHGNSVSTCYAHQSRFGTFRGAVVRQGEVIGYVGNTGHSFGAHLHFEVRIDGRPVDPMDFF